MQKNISFVLLTGILFLSACSTTTPAVKEMMNKPTEAMMDKPTQEMMEKPTDAMMDKPTQEMMEKPTDAMMDKPTQEMMEKPTDAMMETPSAEMMAPEFVQVSLTNVNTGESFKISDYSGKVVLVENLAMWCPSCKKQQEQIKVLNEALGMHSDLITIGFDVDPNENAADLKKYIDNNGFNWVYAVPPQEILNEIGKVYGANFLNPPSTPILVIDRKGGVHPLPFGIKSTDDLQKILDPFLAEGM